MSKQYTLNQLIEKSLKVTKSSYAMLCNFKINVNGEDWDAYDSSVCHRDILLYCDQGTVTLLVDSYGNRDIIEIFDWNKYA